MPKIKKKIIYIKKLTQNDGNPFDVPYNSIVPAARVFSLIGKYTKIEYYYGETFVFTDTDSVSRRKMSQNENIPKLPANNARRAYF